MRSVCWTIFLLSAVFLVSSVGAEPTPSTIHYQSYLSDEFGEPLADGAYDITFRIYDVLEGGEALWTEGWTGENSVDLVNSRFSVNLGSLSSFEIAGLDFSEQYYLEIQIATDDPFSPRLGFNTVPYAMHAKNMEGTPLPDGDVVGTTDVQTLTNKTLTGPNIEGGTIDNTIIGATTPAEGSFTTLSATGDLTVAGTILGRATIQGTEIFDDYTLTDTDNIILVNTTVGAVTLTLPPAAGNAGRTYTIKLSTAVNRLTIVADGSETMDGHTTLRLETAGQAVRLVSDGSNWVTVGEVGNVTRRHDTSDEDLTSDDVNLDYVVLDDMIVDGSECIGLDCENGEFFGFDTLRLKENNLRIHFQDTSNAASFPTNDWRIVVNDAMPGGRNYFAIQDVDNDMTGLVVEAGGNVGLGTTGAPQGRLDVQTTFTGGTGTVTVDRTAVTEPVNGTISSSGTIVIGSGTLFMSDLVVGAELTSNGETRTVTSILGDTTLYVDIPFSPDLSAGTAYTYLYYVENGLTGTGTAFLTELAVGDTLFVAGFSRVINAITSDTELTVANDFNEGIVDAPFAFKGAGAQPQPGFLVTVDGKIGIGTATPEEKFEIEFAPGVDVQIGRGSTDPNVTFIALRSPDGTKYYITVDNDGNLVTSTTKP
jgi:hypothetical protein